MAAAAIPKRTTSTTPLPHRSRRIVTITPQTAIAAVRHHHDVHLDDNDERSRSDSIIVTGAQEARLRRALMSGRRNFNVREVARQTGLDRRDVLQWYDDNDEGQSSCGCSTTTTKTRVPTSLCMCMYVCTCRESESPREEGQGYG